MITKFFVWADVKIFGDRSDGGDATFRFSYDSLFSNFWGAKA